MIMLIKGVYEMNIVCILVGCLYHNFLSKFGILNSFFETFLYLKLDLLNQCFIVGKLQFEF